jgi:hypothetical protein
MQKTGTAQHVDENRKEQKRLMKSQDGTGNLQDSKGLLPQ